MKNIVAATTIAVVLTWGHSAPVRAMVTEELVLKTYSDIALAGYEDSLTTAMTLASKIDALISNPSAETLAAAKEAWVRARRPYQQTEVYRFGNAIVDEWEGKVNAWPLEEGLIDYVTGSYGSESGENPFYVVNVIANKKLISGGKTVDASKITPELLLSLQEVGGIEANVATGYHAIEFLLWGQDLNGTGAGAGSRPHTDFDTASCTNGNCDRRAAYLKAATSLLLSDLEEMVANWKSGGVARKNLMNAEGSKGIKAMLTGMGSLSYGELAGERMKLGLMLRDPEEEHDCFSDNTHESHYYDALGIQNVYLGKYVRVDGSTVRGPGLSALVKSKDGGVDKAIQDSLAATMDKMSVLRKRAETTERYDQMIGEGNTAGHAVVQGAIDALVAQTRQIEKAVSLLGVTISLEGSDSLDNPSAVQ